MTWYEDNVFGEDFNNDRAYEDPLGCFGVQNGMELFSKPDSDDPNVVHILNEGQGTMYEITRMYKKYTDIKGSE